MSALESLTITTGNDDTFSPQLGEKTGVELVPDPAPNEKPTRRRGRGKAAAPAPARPATKSVAALQKEVAEDITTALELIAAGWSVRDDCCAPVLEENAAEMGKAYAAILAKNPRMLQAFAGAGVVSWGLVVAGAVKATKPVAKAVYRNHFGPSAVDNGGGGETRIGVNLDAFPAYTGNAHIH